MFERLTRGVELSHFESGVRYCIDWKNVTKTVGIGDPVSSSNRLYEESRRSEFDNSQCFLTCSVCPFPENNVF